MSHGNHTDKLNKRSVSSHFGEGQVIASTAAERKSDSAQRGCVRSKGVSLWNLELLFEIASCPTRLICTSLLSQHARNGAFPFAESRRLFGPGRPCAKEPKRKAWPLKTLAIFKTLYILKYVLCILLYHFKILGSVFL